MEDQTSISTLQDRINELEAKQAEFLSVIESKENEFGKKRAQFKQIFLQKETELNEKVENLKIANEESARLLSQLKNVSGERDNLKTVVLITQTSNDDKCEDMNSKYQEEITSLKAIMQDAIEETRQDTSAKYEGEQLKLLVDNNELETKLVKYKTQLKALKVKQQEQDDDDDDDGLFDVLSETWNKPSASEEVIPDKDENLEDSMKKAQENAEALRSIVMPLEEEIAALRVKLRNANEKINVFESKEKKQVKSHDTQNVQTSGMLTNAKSAANIEELEEKIKELAQYLEAERSARTDLEMFVAVLNTQKGVLQEDADKLRRELHNVCRLLEQEKEEHVALKDTWEMANDRFLETQQMQRSERDKIQNLLTAEQLKLLKKELKKNSESVELLTPPSPATKKKFADRKMQRHILSKKEKIKTRKVNPAEGKRTLSSFVRGQKPNTSSSVQSSSILDTAIPELDLNVSALLPSVSSIPCTVGGNSQQKDVISNDVIVTDVDHNVKALSDGEGMADIHETSMRKYKSADDLEARLTPVSSNSLEELSFIQNEKSLKVEDLSDRKTRRKENIDWKSFEEAAKSSLSNEVERSCAMCSNYEKQLQKLQSLKEDLNEETSILSKKVKQEQESAVVNKRAYERLEQSVKRASEDAQMQIIAAAETQSKFESILSEININVDNTKEETAKQVSELMESRDSIMANFEQFQENCRKLPLTTDQDYSGDGELNESQKKLEVYEAESRTKEEKLQSEIVFMKDRVMAEQVAKESMEEMYQGEIDHLGRQIRALKKELDNEKQRKIEQQLEVPSSQESATSKEVIATLEKQLQQSSKDKVELEKQLREFKSQLHSLNGQLNDSEAVQRDFVKLSQSLQMELVEMKESQKDAKLHDEN